MMTADDSPNNALTASGSGSRKNKTSLQSLQNKLLRLTEQAKPHIVFFRWWNQYIADASFPTDIWRVKDILCQVGKLVPLKKSSKTWKPLAELLRDVVLKGTKKGVEVTVPLVPIAEQDVLRALVDCFRLGVTPRAANPEQEVLLSEPTVTAVGSAATDLQLEVWDMAYHDLVRLLYDELPRNAGRDDIAFKVDPAMAAPGATPGDVAWAAKVNFYTGKKMCTNNVFMQKLQDPPTVIIIREVLHEYVDELCEKPWLTDYRKMLVVVDDRPAELDRLRAEKRLQCDFMSLEKVLERR